MLYRIELDGTLYFGDGVYGVEVTSTLPLNPAGPETTIKGHLRAEVLYSIRKLEREIVEALDNMTDDVVQ